jgi:glycosyltransferase involved in cell wall biosynthesis
MSFSIITPSFRNSKWLKLCIASVADQTGVEVEHIVQDASSDDGTLDWLPSDPRVQAFVEKDAGMYDAINRGLRRSRGEVLAYLNCDEQYLPETLRRVRDFFAARPEVDVVFGNVVVVDTRGEVICFRKVTLPHKYHAMVCHLPVFTCGTFFRRRVLDEYGLFFDTRWRSCGDAEWVIRLLDRGLRMAVLGSYTSAFADTGENLDMKPVGRRERQAMFQLAPWWARKCVRGLKLAHRLERFVHGAYCQRPFSYAIYTCEQPDRRRDFYVARPTFVWTDRY